MTRVDPASPDFVKLSRRQQACILRHQYGWGVKALTEELGVARRTVQVWTNPGAMERKNAAMTAYRKTETGKQKRSAEYRAYNAKLKARAQQEAA